jgi:hypothetical protein
MTINDKYYVQKKEFVEKLGEVLRLAKPHLVSCEYKLGDELPVEDRYITRQTEDGSTEYTRVDYQPSGEFVIVTCANGYSYRVDVTANSLAAIGEEVFRAMCCK